MERPEWSAVGEMISDLKRAMSSVTDAQRRMVAVTGSGWSPDRMIRVVVGPRGQLLDIEIEPRVLRKPDSKALSASILAAARAAVADATEQTTAIMDESLPSDFRVDNIGGLGLASLMQSHDSDLRREFEASNG